jgi:hypothetical protein
LAQVFFGEPVSTSPGQALAMEPRVGSVYFP